MFQVGSGIASLNSSRLLGYSFVTACIEAISLRNAGERLHTKSFALHPLKVEFGGPGLPLFISTCDFLFLLCLCGLVLSIFPSLSISRMLYNIAF